MPPIRNLLTGWRTGRYATSVFCGSISRHHFDAGMCLEPDAHNIRCSTLEQIDYPMRFQIDQNRAVDATLGLCPVIHTERA
jgi:hypothetical protein